MIPVSIDVRLATRRFIDVARLVVRLRCHTGQIAAMVPERRKVTCSQCHYWEFTKPCTCTWTTVLVQKWVDDPRLVAAETEETDAADALMRAIDATQATHAPHLELAWECIVQVGSTADLGQLTPGGWRNTYHAALKRSAAARVKHAREQLESAERSICDIDRWN